MDGYRTYNPKGPVRIRVVTPTHAAGSLSGGDSSAVEHLNSRRLPLLARSRAVGGWLSLNRSPVRIRVATSTHSSGRRPTQWGHQPIERLESSITIARSRAVDGRLSGSTPSAPPAPLAQQKSAGITNRRRPCDSVREYPGLGDCNQKTSPAQTRRPRSGVRVQIPPQAPCRRSSTGRGSGFKPRRLRVRISPPVRSRDWHSLSMHHGPVRWNRSLVF